MCVVDRRILEEEDPRPDLHAGLDDLQDGPPSGAVGVPVEQRRLHIVPPAQRVEAVLVVPVERELVAEPAPRGVGIVVDGDVVGVVVDRRRRC
jgi:hypothetical protein